MVRLRTPSIRPPDFATPRCNTVTRRHPAAPGFQGETLMKKTNTYCAGTTGAQETNAKTAPDATATP
jgi:hypothetical protein